MQNLNSKSNEYFLLFVFTAAYRRMISLLEMSEERFFVLQEKLPPEMRRGHCGPRCTHFVTDNEASHATNCTLVQVSPSPK